ncbi:hypothetical protein EJB05_26687, partial [Eragrostis curvula]
RGGIVAVGGDGTLKYDSGDASHHQHQVLEDFVNNRVTFSLYQWLGDMSSPTILRRCRELDEFDCRLLSTNLLSGPRGLPDAGRHWIPYNAWNSELP